MRIRYKVKQNQGNQRHNQRWVKNHPRDIIRIQVSSQFETLETKLCIIFFYCFSSIMVPSKELDFSVNKQTILFLKFLISR